MKTWVPHIACYVVTRQIVEMGNASKRSADSCESYGAMIKKVIKHLTCRRRHGAGVESSHRKGELLWRQTFKRGYVEQCFRRTCVRTSLLHGAENAKFLERHHFRLRGEGRLNKSDLPQDTCHLSVEHVVRAIVAKEAEEA